MKMKRNHRKNILCILTACILCLVASSFCITASADYYDEDGNYITEDYDDEYTNYTDENTQVPQDSGANPTFSSQDSSLSSVDTSELTSNDWSALQESLNSNFNMSAVEVSGDSDDDAFKQIKQAGSGSNDSSDGGGNDTWTYLVWGIVLLAAGVGIIFAVIATTLYTKKNLNARARLYRRKNHFEDILSDKNIRNAEVLDENEINSKK